MRTHRVNLVAFLLLATTGSAVPIAVAAPDHPPPPRTPPTTIEPNGGPTIVWTDRALTLTVEGPPPTTIPVPEPAPSTTLRSNEPAVPVVAPRPAPTIVVESPPPMSYPLPPGIAAIIADAALRHGIDPVLFARIAWCESKGDPGAYNPSGASGLFQQLARYWPGRADAAGLTGADIFDPVANAEVSASMMAAIGTSPWNASRRCWS